MSALKLSSRYAKSLIMLAREQTILGEVLKDMTMLKNLFDENRDFVIVMKSPIIPADKKQDVIETAFKGKINDLTLRFINILITKGRERYFPDIVGSYVIRNNELHNISPVKLITAVELDDQQRNNIKEFIKDDRSVGKIELETIVDPEIIGGFVIQYQDKLLDSSVSSRLRTLRKNIEDSSYKVKF